MEFVVNAFGEIPTGAYLALAGGLGVSLLTEMAKKYLSLQSDKVITFLVLALSFATSAIEYIITAVAQNPGILGTHTASVLAASTLAYRFIVKPAKNLLGDAKSFRNNTLAHVVSPLADMPIPQDLSGTANATIATYNEPIEYIDDMVAVAPVAESEFPA